MVLPGPQAPALVAFPRVPRHVLWVLKRVLGRDRHHRRHAHGLQGDVALHLPGRGRAAHAAGGVAAVVRGKEVHARLAGGEM